MKSTIIIVLSLLLPGMSAAPVLSGLDVLAASGFEPLRGKRVGVLCNHTAVTLSGEHLLDLLVAAPGVTVEAAFAPEHGLRGTADAGAAVTDMDDASLPYPVYSLYDETRAPTSAEMVGLDLLICDFQDVGVRFYTRLSTLGLTLAAAGKAGLPVMVLDRPNVLSGLNPEGPLCEPEHFSFIGMYPIPVRHALTVGELARLIVAEDWVEGAAQADLTVIPCEGWRRAMLFEETGRAFTPTSPNIPTIECARAYTATCFFEGTHVSEGRGTDAPFTVIGAPFIDAEAWAAALEACDLAGVAFDPITFTPEANAGSSAPKLEGEVCRGVRVRVTDPRTFRPVRTGLAMLWTLAALHPEELTFREGHFDRLWGTSTVRGALERLMDTGEGDWRALAGDWEEGVERHWQRAQPHLLYD